MADKRTLELIISAKDRASPVLKGVGNVLGGLGKAAALGATVFAGAAAGMGAGLLKLALDAAPLENIQLSFENLAGSAGFMGDEMLAALEKSSSGMISQRDLMESFNSAAQLVSKDFAVQLPDAMQYLSKISAATGEDMTYMLDSLVTGVGRLSPAILDNLKIQVSLEEATARAAEMFGVEADQLTKAQTQAGMMDVVLQKLQTNTAALPEVAGSSAAKIGEMGAKFQNLKDQIGLRLLPILQPFLDWMLQMGEKYGPIVVEMFGEFADKLQTVLPPAIAIVNDALSRIGQALGLTTEDVSGMDVIMGMLKGTLDAVIIGIQAGALAFEAVALAVECGAEAVETLKRLLDEFKASVEDSAILEVLSGLAGGGGGGGGLRNLLPGRRQAGGPVQGGFPYVVGERGPELFVPGQSGNVVSNRDLAGAMGAGAQAAPQVIQLVVDGRVLAEVVSGHQGRSARQSARMGGMATL